MQQTDDISPIRQDLCMEVLEYVRGLLGLGWLYSPLVLGLIRDKGPLLKGQVSDPYL